MAIKTIYQGPNGAVGIDTQQNVTVSANYTLQPSDYIVTATGAGSFTITLQPAGPSNGKSVLIKCLTTASVTVNAYTGEFIDTFPSKTLVNGEVLDIVSDGTKWVDTVGTSISGSKIIDGTISDSKLSSNAVTEIKIANSAITEAKIANNAVTAAKIATGAVGNDEINTSSSPTVNTIYTNNWFRSYGATGWYNETYGGGWYMSDNSSVRSYNNLPVRAYSFIASPGGFNADSGFYTYSGGIETTMGTIYGRAFQCTGDAKMICTGMSAVFPNTSTGCELTLNGNDANLYFGTFRPYRFAWQSDRNVVLYSGSTPVWASGTATSDIRTKENIKKYENISLNIIKQLSVVEFNYIKEIDENQIRRVGFIAQEVEKIITHAVKSVGPDEENQTLLLHKEEIVPYLVKAIQEQQEQIQSLEERIKKLEELVKS